MPKFDRSVLAKLFPGNPKAISDFEKLNRTVDEALPEATAGAQSIADEARAFALLARPPADVLAPLFAAVDAYVQTARSERAAISALERRVADLEAQLRALRPVDVDQLRRQLADLQSLHATR